MTSWVQYTPESKQEVLTTIRNFIESELPYHLNRFDRERSRYVIDGHEQNNPYIPVIWFEELLPRIKRKLGVRWEYYLVHIFGKTIRMLAWLMGFRSKSERIELLTRYRGLLRFLLRTRNQTWGLSNAMVGLMDLQRLSEEDGQDYLGLVFSRADISYMKADLHWKRHYDPRTQKLKGLPNNYFPVMAWVALGRYRLGWDDESMLQYFTERCLKIFSELSTHGWFDDTGCGTYDVYHSVATFELTELLFAYDPGLVSQMEVYCDNLVEEYLYQGQLDGSGFPFGRTIGVNGDMWMASGLLVTMVVGFGKPEQYRNYYDLAVAAITKSLNFWYDSEKRISDKWYGGRKTDPYMDKHRIVDATYDLYLRLIQAHDLIEKLSVDEWTDQQPPITRSAKLFLHNEDVEHPKATFVYKDKDLSFSFPLTCHGKPSGWLHLETNYLPNIRTNFYFETPIYVYQPFLNPRVSLADGTSFMPYVFYKNIKSEPFGRGYVLIFEQEKFLLNSNNECVDGLKYRCVWLMEGRRFLRLDLWLPQKTLQINSYEIEFATEGRFVAEESGLYRFNVLDYHVYFGLCDDNFSLRANLRDVSNDSDYGCYSGQCQNAVTLSGEEMLLRADQLYYSVFAVGIMDKAEVALQKKEFISTDFTVPFDGHQIRLQRDGAIDVS